MQYKNSSKSGLRSCIEFAIIDNLNNFEEEELTRSQSKRLYSPKYISPNPTTANDQFSPRNQTTASRHWKSYLAPELARLSPRENNMQQDADLASPVESSVNRLKGYSSAYNLRQYDGNNLSSQLEEKNAGEYPHQSHTLRKEQYSRRKQEIMNRIKLLQERASLEDERPQNTSHQQSQLRMLNTSTQEDLSVRVSALEQRVENMAAQYEVKLKRQIAEVEKRLRAEFRPK